MPRDYGKIRHGFWSGTGETRRRLRSLPIEVQTVAAYLMSCGSSNMIGLYYLPIPLIVHEIGSGLTLEGASTALRRLSEVGFAYYDDTQEIVFVPNMAREQIAETLKPNDSQVRGVIAQLEEYKKSRFVADFLAIYKDAYHLPDLAFPVCPSTPPRRPLDAPSTPENRDQRTENISLPARACDPSSTITEHGVPDRKMKPRGVDLLTWFGAERAKAFPSTLPWLTAKNADGDAETFVAKIPDDAVKDIIPTMARFFAHVVAGDKGWDAPKNTKDPSFAFGSWKSGFTALLEEIRGCAPRTKQEVESTTRPDSHITW